MPNNNLKTEDGNGDSSQAHWIFDHFFAVLDASKSNIIVFQICFIQKLFKICVFGNNICKNVHIPIVQLRWSYNGLKFADESTMDNEGGILAASVISLYSKL